MNEEAHSKHGPGFSLMGSALHIGFFIVATVLFFVLGGLWLDKTFNTIPLFIIVGVILSLAASMYEVFRIIRKISPGSPKKL